MIESECDKEVLDIIEHFPSITYNEIVNISKWSPSTIHLSMRRLKKEKKIFPNKIISKHLLKTKAKGWFINTMHEEYIRNLCCAAMRCAFREGMISGGIGHTVIECRQRNPVITYCPWCGKKL